MNDPIVDEVRRIRDAHAARFNYDLWAIYKDIKEKQAASGLKFVSFADEKSEEVPAFPGEIEPNPVLSSVAPLSE